MYDLEVSLFVWLLTVSSVCLVILKLFTDAARYHATQLARDVPEYYSKLCQLVRSDGALKVNAVDSLAGAISSNDGKLAFAKLGMWLARVVERVLGRRGS